LVFRLRRDACLALAMAILATASACRERNPAYLPAQADPGSSAADAAADRVQPRPEAAAPDRRPEAPIPGDGPAPAVADGLVAYLRLDEGVGTTARDSTGQRNDGTLVNGPAWTASSFPGAKFPDPGSLSFDGTDDYVDVAVRTLPALGRPVSIALWFSISSSPGPARRNLVALSNPVVNHSLQLGLEDGHVAVWHWNGIDPSVLDSTVASLGWHHVACTYDGTTERLYVDKTLVGSRAAGPGEAALTVARIGSYGSAADGEIFRGVIDDVRVYARALTATEVATLASGQ
jgi:hypothetical protein